MTKIINPLDPFTLRDLTQEDGFILEIGDELCEPDEEEEFSYTPHAHISNQEALHLLKVDDFQEEGEEENDDMPQTFFSMSFEKLKSKMTDISGNGKVMKWIKQKGVGDLVAPDSQVTLNYVGYFEYRDEPFDSTFARNGDNTYRLGRGSLLPGLEIGIATMKKHEVAVFILHPDFAYGSLGCAPRIPPNEEVLFTVHLLDFLDNGSADTFENLSKEEQELFANNVKRVQAMLLTAKSSFQRNKTRQAIREYMKAISWLDKSKLLNDKEQEEMKKLLTRAYSNLAVCYNKENLPRRACSACNNVPIPTAKTHFNHGRALLKMGEYNRAMQELHMALKLEPQNNLIIKEIRMANQKQRKYLEFEKRLWSKCLQSEEEVKNVTMFQQAARDLCQAFLDDTQLLRQPLPDGLTPLEDKYIREQAAASGLTVTTHERYGKQVVYLNKPNY